MEVELIFLETRIRHRKRYFDENARVKPIQGVGKNFRVNFFFFYQIVDNVLSSLKTSFEQFKKYEETFGILFNLRKLKDADDESLTNSCAALEYF